MKNNNTKKIIRNCSLYMLYVMLIISMLCTIGGVNVVTTYNISGVSSLKSLHMLDKYVPPEPEVPEVQYKVSDEPIRQYRLTSFFPHENDGKIIDRCVGAGFCYSDFELNERGWYTYQGKLVLAAATPYLQKRFGVRDEITYFKYYDEVNVTIDGKVYPGIILDTCGACYRDVRLDLYVEDGLHGIDRGYRGKNMITVEVTKKKA